MMGAHEVRRGAVLAPPLVPPLRTFSRNALLPLRAMVPRFSTSSARSMPMPLSAMVSVPCDSAVVMVMRSGVSGSTSASPATVRWRAFSSASDALDTSSLVGGGGDGWVGLGCRCGGAEDTKRVHGGAEEVCVCVCVGSRRRCPPAPLTRAPDEDVLVRVQAVGNDVQ